MIGLEAKIKLLSSTIPPIVFPYLNPLLKIQRRKVHRRKESKDQNHTSFCGKYDRRKTATVDDRKV